MFKDLKLRTKIILLAVSATMVPVLIVSIFSSYENTKMRNVSTEESIKLATTDLDHIADGVYRMCQTQNDVLTKSLRNYLNVVRKMTSDLGGISFAKDTVAWDAVNQITKESRSVRLPKMMVGASPFGQVRDTATPVPVVDQIGNLAEDVSCTIFQRMNEKGDMIRAATNVVEADGARALGTYIPRFNLDGKENPVLTSVFSGKTYQGRAFVVDRWYLTVYEPIYDANKNVTGMLSVGIPQESVKSLRQAIYNIKIGKTGYLFVLDSQGHYVISEKGKRDGQDISQSKDSDGNLFVQDIVAQALALDKGGVGQTRYTWQNPGEPEPRMKVARIMYFEPWDWVIGAGSYEDEFLDAANRIEDLAQRSLVFEFGITFGAIILFGFLGIVVARAIAGPVLNIVQAVNKVARDRDLTVQVPVEGKDEVGVMASEFNRMMKLLRESFRVVTGAAREVQSHAGDVAQRATANRERAENQVQQMKFMTQTVKDMRKTAAEVSGASEAQREAAEHSSGNVVRLLEGMKTVSAASGSQVEEANAATGRVQAMGDTGAKVVQNAQRQGAQVVAVTQAVSRMGLAVKELSNATTSAMDFANDALRAVEEGTESVGATVEGMKAIAESSEQISEIITVITDIAEQTNLLSLNAAIEAARAGVHGKGFAVVADEVGKLAQRSSEAAKEITQLIKDSSSRVTEGTQLSNRSREVLEKIASGGGANLKAIQEIAQKAENIAAGT